ncbi:MAG: mechanosensitive ion channel family protein [Anaerolineae bacterium]|nr:mechanosensitive ion channel family protein [Anaerolineae bacterium]
MEIPQVLLELLSQFLLFLPKLLVAIVVFLLTLVAAGLLNRIVGQALDKRKVNPSLRLLICKISLWTTIILGSIIALEQVNFDVTAFLAGVGIVGFTVGFAIQDVSKNFVAGLLLLLQQPFEIGDAIQVGDFAGTVKTIDLRATELQTMDGRTVLIPNADVFTSPIVNYGLDKTRRINLAIGVAYDSDLDLVRQVTVEALTTISGVHEDPGPHVVFNNFGPSTIDGTVYYSINRETIGVMDARDAGIRKLKTAYEQAGIDMPYPTQTIRLQQ